LNLLDPADDRRALPTAHEAVTADDTQQAVEVAERIFAAVRRPLSDPPSPQTVGLCQTCVKRSPADTSR
jgi:hypothetical protein